MLTASQLDKMSRTAVDTVDKADLVDINTVTVDTSLPAPQRLESYLEQVKNPYCFRCGETTVRVRFNPEGKDLGILLKNYFVGLKTGRL